MPRPICTDCEREMTCEKTGHPILYLHADDTPHAVAFGDRFECPVCSASVVVNLGAQEHSQEAIEYAMCQPHTELRE